MSSLTDKYQLQVENILQVALHAKERIAYLKGITFYKEPESSKIRASEFEQMIKSESLILAKDLEKINDELHKF